MRFRALEEHEFDRGVPGSCLGDYEVSTDEGKVLGRTARILVGQALGWTFVKAWRSLRIQGPAFRTRQAAAEDLALLSAELE